MSDDEEEKPGFFSTPVGLLVMVLLVIIGIGFVSYLVQKFSGKSRGKVTWNKASNKNYRPNNNNLRMSDIPNNLGI